MEAQSHTPATATAAFAAPAVIASPASWLVASPVLQQMVTSGIATATANVATNPLDMVKTRMQLQHPPRGLVATGVDVVRNEGVLALWKGWPPAVARGVLGGGVRLGLYGPIKSAIGGEKNCSLAMKLTAGTISGVLSSVVSSPTELIKTRMQAGSQTQSAMSVFRNVIAQDGVLGLWKGAAPGATRTAVLTAVQCATYDQVKREVMKAFGWGDSAATHLVTAMTAGLISTTVCNPLDVVKTQMFMGGSKYSGPVQCTIDVYRQRGLRGFMRGFTANYTRLGPQTVIMFMCAEQLRALAGIKSL